MENKKGGQFAHLIPILKKHVRYIWYGAIATIFANSLALIIPYLVKEAFDVVQAGQPLSAVFTLCAYMVGLTVAAGIFRFFMRRTIIWASRKVEYDFRGILFAKWLDLDPSYYDRTRTGDLMAHATNDIEAVRMMIGPGIMHLMNTFVSTIVAIAFMLKLSTTLTITTVLPLFLLALSYNILGQLVHKKFMIIQEKFSFLTAQVQENLAGVRVVRAYGRERSETDRFAKTSRDYADLNLDMMKVYGFFRPLLFVIAGGITLLMLYIGGREIMAQRITLGTLVAFYGYLGWLVWPMMALGWVVSLYQRGTASLKRINTILDSESKIVRGDKPQNPASDIKGRIEFRNLSFAYPVPASVESRAVLHDIDLVVEPGSRLGITGPTGSGKTALVSLIPRLYPIAAGQLFIDDVDITLWPLDTLRDAIGFVSQETFLFSDTLEANINFSSDGLLSDKIVDISRLAALHEDVETFPDRYDTILGERGITLSGGQKQRTALARAILKSPAIIILDDATSSVDTETEQHIYENLEQILPGRTSIIISHRVSSLKNCDKIIYLDDGRIIEEGDHDSLVRKNGAYASLFRRQMMEDRLESM